MPARTKRIFHDENTRKKIQASQLINRLTKHVLAKADDPEVMTPSQVTAALGLLRKTLPDLAAVEVTGEMEHTHQGIDAPPQSQSFEEWMKRHVGTTAGTAGRRH